MSLEASGVWVLYLCKLLLIYTHQRHSLTWASHQPFQNQCGLSSMWPRTVSDQRSPCEFPQLWSTKSLPLTLETLGHNTLHKSLKSSEGDTLYMFHFSFSITWDIRSRKPTQCHPGPVSCSSRVWQLLLCEDLTLSTAGEAGSLGCTSHGVLSTAVSARM